MFTYYYKLELYRPPKPCAQVFPIIHIFIYFNESINIRYRIKFKHHSPNVNYKNKKPSAMAGQVLIKALYNNEGNFKIYLFLQYVSKLPPHM